MRFFHKIAEGVNIGPLMAALSRQPDLWDENTLRTKTSGTPHNQVSDIWLWFNDVEQDPKNIVDDKEVIPYRAWALLPQVRPIVFDLMRYLEATRLGRVVITRLPPGAKIPMHVDEGAPATYYSRYQLALQSRPGAIFTIGDEEVNFKDGEIWWIDNQTEHGVFNNSSDDRIVMIMDVRSE